MPSFFGKRILLWATVLVVVGSCGICVNAAKAQQYRPVKSEVDSAKNNQVREEQKSAYQSATKDGPKLNPNCPSGKMVGQCMTDYCGNDAPDSVTACVSETFVQQNAPANKYKCWPGYGCGGTRNYCCVIPQQTAGECFWDYESADRGNVTFVCAANLDECKTKYPGGSSMNGQFGCSAGVCCKVSKGIAQKAQNSECYLDYAGADSGNVHFTCSQNEDACKADGGASAGSGFGCGSDKPVCCKKQGVAPTGSTVSGRTARKNIPINSFCFTAKECAEAGGTWRAGEGCSNKGNLPQGRCTAPEPDYELQNPIIGATTIRGLRSFIGLIFTAGISFALIAAAIMFVFGAFKYMVSAVGAQISRAKETMIDALIGMVLALTSYVILANVAPNTLNMNAFKIDMINRLSFYNVVYCKDLKAGPKEQELMYQDAGTIDKPENLDITKGYPVKSEATQCGRQYFIGGSDSQTVCNGMKCNNGVCLNCASGLSECGGVHSTAVFKCSNTQFGGNVMTNSGVTPEDVYLTAFCRWTESGSSKAKSVDLAKTKMNNATVNGGSASGKVGGYAFKNLSSSKDEFNELINECKKHGVETYAALIAVFSSDAETWEKAVPYFGWSSLAINKMSDVRWVVTKRFCNRNLANKNDAARKYYWGLDTFDSLIEKNSLDVFMSTEQTSLKNVREGKVNLGSELWSVDEVKKLMDDPNSIMECGFQLTGI